MRTDGTSDKRIQIKEFYTFTESEKEHSGQVMKWWGKHHGGYDDGGLHLLWERRPDFGSCGQSKKISHDQKEQISIWPWMWQATKSAWLLKTSINNQIFNAIYHNKPMKDFLLCVTAQPVRIRQLFPILLPFFAVSWGPAPDPTFHWIISEAMGLNFLENVRCMLFRSLTQFHTLLRFGGNGHCLPIRVGRSRNLVGVKRAMVPGELAIISLTSVSIKFLEVDVGDQSGRELRASPLHFWPRDS